MLHHPDRHVHADDSVKEKEESVFKDVSEAYTVLSDSRKRARYDTGQDVEEMGTYSTTELLGVLSGVGPRLTAVKIFFAFVSRI